MSKSTLLSFNCEDNILLIYQPYNFDNMEYHYQLVEY